MCVAANCCTNTFIGTFHELITVQCNRNFKKEGNNEWIGGLRKITFDSFDGLLFDLFDLVVIEVEFF